MDSRAALGLATRSPGIKDRPPLIMSATKFPKRLLPSCAKLGTEKVQHTGGQVPPGSSGSPRL